MRLWCCYLPWLERDVEKHIAKYNSHVGCEAVALTLTLPRYAITYEGDVDTYEGLLSSDMKGNWIGTLAITRESGRTVLVRLGPGVSIVVGDISLNNITLCIINYNPDFRYAIGR